MFAHTANSIIGIAHARCEQQPRVVCDSAAACWERSIVQRLCEMASLGKRESDVSEMEEGKDTCVHGIPVHVSPKKESRNTKGLYYFDAKLSDGKKCARLVSFDIAH